MISTIIPVNFTSTRRPARTCIHSGVMIGATSVVIDVAVIDNARFARAM